jgi:hypothetical protein
LKIENLKLKILKFLVFGLWPLIFDLFITIRDIRAQIRDYSRDLKIENLKLKIIISYPG